MSTDGTSPKLPAVSLLSAFKHFPDYVGVDSIGSL
jgi:hypothetical protein